MIQKYFKFNKKEFHLRQQECVTLRYRLWESNNEHQKAFKVKIPVNEETLRNSYFVIVVINTILGILEIFCLSEHVRVK